jgi:hypothetical protein
MTVPSAPRGRFNIPRLAGAVEWESLGLLREIVALRVGYYGVFLIPILAYAVLEWNRIAPFLIKDMPPVELPKILFFIFLGSMFLALGHLLNEVLCPKLIKLHGTLHRYQSTLAEYVANQDAIFRAAQTAEQLIILHEIRMKLPSEQGSPELEELTRRTAAATARAIAQSWQLPDSSLPLLTGHQKEWDAANTRLPVVRWAIATLYGLAAAVAAGLAVVQLGRVLCATFGSQIASHDPIGRLFNLCH